MMMSQFRRGTGTSGVGFALGGKGEHVYSKVGEFSGLSPSEKPPTTPKLIKITPPKPTEPTVVEVTEGGEEGALLGLGLLEVLLLECLLVEFSFRLVFRGVLTLVLTLVGVVLVGGVLVPLGAVGDKVVGVSIAVASFLWTPPRL
jgi:hypothetical protein